MNSKELLEEYYEYVETQIVDDIIEKLKPHLERLEQLEKENQELKKSNKEIEELYLNENKHWCETIDSLRKENTKLKLAIDVLKDKKVVVSHLLETKSVGEYNFPFKNFSSSFLTQEEFELLRSVLENDR